MSRKLMDPDRFESMIADFRQLFSRQRQRRRRRMKKFFSKFDRLLDEQRQKRLHRIKEFLSLFGRHFAKTGRPIAPTRGQPPEERAERLRDFFTTWEDERPEPAADFNVFPLLRVKNNEVIHSRFLSWLFDCRESHGQQHLFAEAFLKRCGLSPEEETLRRYSVRAEFSQRESVIDIVMYRQWDFIVYVENKINAGEQSDQLAREYRDMRRFGRVLHVPDDRQIAVFLTPTGRDPVSDDPARWLCLSYPQLADILRPTLEDISDPRARFIVRDWLKTADSLR
ncbi:MAG: PD-(D/E)XK nuclease family protein [Armatimonadota bacterium]